jgi:hypothetical protein
MRLSSTISKVFGRRSAVTSREAPVPRQFLIVFDTQRGRIVEQRLFVDPDEAMAAFSEIERRHAQESQLQVLLFTADSLSAVKSTHPHYFSESGPSTDPFGVKPVATAH